MLLALWNAYGWQEDEGNNQGGGGLYLYLKYKERLKLLAEAAEHRDKQEYENELESVVELKETIEVNNNPYNIDISKFVKKVQKKPILAKKQNNINYDLVFKQVQKEILKIDKAIELLAIKEKQKQKEKEDELAAELLILTAFYQ